MSGAVFPLKGEQRQAVDPHGSVWLSASAGTGKTQVLASRVLRLLLREDVAPGEILALTFTKAGAAEMAERVNATLARWVRMGDGELGRELGHLGAPVDPAVRGRARQLFARVLDCPGGGLRIDTIHAFSQWLLAAFPSEAGLQPGARAMEDRDRALLTDSVLAAMLTAPGGDDFADALAELSLRHGPDGAKKWLARCAAARDVWFGRAGWQGNVEPRIKTLLGLTADASEADLAPMCADEAFDMAGLRRSLALCEGWNTKTGRAGAAFIREWTAMEPAARAETIGDFFGSLFNKSGTDIANLKKRDADYESYAAGVRASIERVIEHRALLALVDTLKPAFAAGRRFALAWDEAKAREGLIDFDDQIALAARLLKRADMADWIRYKLDRRFDHILIDEAQDTNRAQWDIVDALTEEFFAGSGQKEGRQRTLFAVGDHKQAIFGFQGTSPENFADARERYRDQIGRLADDALGGRRGNSARELATPDLRQSYRTAQPILDVVDETLDRLGGEALGLDGPAPKHEGLKLPGLVRLWKPVSDADLYGADAADDDGQDGDDAVLTGTDRELAERIARQCRAWIDEGYPLAKGRPRRAGAGDIMVLVRKRKELAGLIVARLHAAGVPVAGVDRLRLGAPLAVKDCLAALRFAAQPLDDLSLANLLVSPLIGWTQDELCEHAIRPGRTRLWRHLRESDAPLVARTVERLRALLSRADYDTPQALLQWMLVGPWQGRRRIVARLGTEANDPVDELLNAAAAHQGAHTASITGFLRWFDAGEGDLKREAEGAGDRVRVMTVHGAKGLQAPIVILADATGDPANDPKPDLSLREDVPGGGGLEVPIPSLPQAECVGPLALALEKAKATDREEHWRLLYVAMTRAEEALFLGGKLGKGKEAPPEASWYAAVVPLLSEATQHDPIFGERRDRGAPASGPPDAASTQTFAPDSLPTWARRPLPAEPRPARPLAPSALATDDSPRPPRAPDAAAEEAARRGVLIHALLERLPDLEPERRDAAARAWLTRHAAELDDGARDAMIGDVCGLLDDPAFARVFAPGSLAEVPIAARVGDDVVAGTVDRLAVTDEAVLVVDFKTTRRPPAGLGAVPPATLRQMAAYAAALATIYPGRRIEAALLYTHAPRLIAISADTLHEAQAQL